MKLLYKSFVMVALVCIVILGAGAISKTYALESADVFTTFSSEYLIDSENTAVVSISVKFVNQGENPTILTSYDLTLGNILPSNVVVMHEEQDLSFGLQEGQGSVIRISFGNATLRSGEEYVTDIQYEIKNLLSEIGGAYDLVLPVFASGTNSSTDYIKIVYPSSYGVINYSNTDYTVNEENSNLSLLFTEFSDFDHLYLSIGSQKRFSLNLERIFRNDQETYVKSEYILPPNLDHQKVVLSSISPYPDYIYKSDEGNYVLSFDIAPDQEIWLRISGYVLVDVPQDSRYYLSVSQISALTNTMSEWWGISDEDLLGEIESLEADLSVEEKIDWIYNYVLSTLSLSENFRDLHGFDYRKGADIALKTYKNASAEDFADSFIGLARTMQIPARLVAGYVFPYSIAGNSLGMFHVWPQYWTDSYGWVSVDPAYEAYTEYPHRNKVGLNRVVVAVAPDDLDTVEFEDTSTEFFLTRESVVVGSSMDAETDVAESVDSGTVFRGSVIIHNLGNTVLYDVKVSSGDSEFDLSFDEDFIRDVILPGESIEIGFNASISDWCESGEKLLGVAVVAESSEGTHRLNLEEYIDVSSVWWAEPVSWVLTVLLFVVVTFGLYILVLFFARLVGLVKKLVAMVRVKYSSFKLKRMTEQEKKSKVIPEDK
ncbi:MAG: transglutaminase domain-containing protein [Patescibacteria group bacterium]|nr:transglutaminase domain-containing protein [Patescibacteria group bacterium]